ncbi:hypothetical protein HDU76_000090 [Blyttiomyces sp. JEL0837]|nr:hypothetical protein HDU76_000090 [Blyttiomyces sp. JEL0837]
MPAERDFAKLNLKKHSGPIKVRLPEHIKKQECDLPVFNPGHTVINQTSRSAQALFILMDPLADYLPPQAYTSLLSLCRMTNIYRQYTTYKSRTVKNLSIIQAPYYFRKVCILTRAFELNRHELFGYLLPTLVNDQHTPTQQWKRSIESWVVTATNENKKEILHHLLLFKRHFEDCDMGYTTEPESIRVAITKNQRGILETLLRDDVLQFGRPPEQEFLHFIQQSIESGPRNIWAFYMLVPVYYRYGGDLDQVLNMVAMDGDTNHLFFIVHLFPAEVANLVQIRGGTYLFSLVKKNKLEMMRLFVTYFSIEFDSDCLDRLLCIAAGQGFLDMMKQLIIWGANVVTACDISPHVYPNMAYVFWHLWGRGLHRVPNSDEVMQMLIDAGIDLERNEETRGLLVRVCRVGSLAELNLVLTGGVRVDGRHGLDALSALTKRSIYIDWNCRELLDGVMVKRLISAGLDVGAGLSQNAIQSGNFLPVNAVAQVMGSYRFDHGTVVTWLQSLCHPVEDYQHAIYVLQRVIGHVDLDGDLRDLNYVEVVCKLYTMGKCDLGFFSALFVHCLMNESAYKIETMVNAGAKFKLDYFFHLIDRWTKKVGLTVEIYHVFKNLVGLIDPTEWTFHAFSTALSLAMLMEGNFTAGLVSARNLLEKLDFGKTSCAQLQALAGITKRQWVMYFVSASEVETRFVNMLHNGYALISGPQFGDMVGGEFDALCIAVKRCDARLVRLLACELGVDVKSGKEVAITFALQLSQSEERDEIVGMLIGAGENAFAANGLAFRNVEDSKFMKSLIRSARSAVISHGMTVYQSAIDALTKTIGNVNRTFTCEQILLAAAAGSEVWEVIRALQSDSNLSRCQRTSWNEMLIEAASLCRAPALAAYLASCEVTIEVLSRALVAACTYDVNQDHQSKTSTVLLLLFAGADRYWNEGEALRKAAVFFNPWILKVLMYAKIDDEHDRVDIGRFFVARNGGQALVTLLSLKNFEGFEFLLSQFPPPRLDSRYNQELFNAINRVMATVYSCPGLDTGIMSKVEGLSYQYGEILFQQSQFGRVGFPLTLLKLFVHYFSWELELDLLDQLLCLAAGKGLIDMMQQLILWGANVVAASEIPPTVFPNIVHVFNRLWVPNLTAVPRSDEVIKMLLDAGLDLNRNDQTKGLIVTVCQSGGLKGLNALLEAGADVDGTYGLNALLAITKRTFPTDLYRADIVIGSMLKPLLTASPNIGINFTNYEIRRGETRLISAVSKAIGGPCRYDFNALVAWIFNPAYSWDFKRVTTLTVIRKFDFGAEIGVFNYVDLEGGRGTFAGTRNLVNQIGSIELKEWAIGRVSSAIDPNLKQLGQTARGVTNTELIIALVLISENEQNFKAMLDGGTVLTVAAKKCSSENLAYGDNDNYALWIAIRRLDVMLVKVLVVELRNQIIATLIEAGANLFANNGLLFKNVDDIGMMKLFIRHARSSMMSHAPMFYEHAAGSLVTTPQPINIPRLLIKAVTQCFSVNISEQLSTCCILRHALLTNNVNNVEPNVYSMCKIMSFPGYHRIPHLL